MSITESNIKLGQELWLVHLCDVKMRFDSSLEQFLSIRVVVEDSLKNCLLFSFNRIHLGWYVIILLNLWRIFSLQCLVTLIWASINNFFCRFELCTLHFSLNSVSHVMLRTWLQLWSLKLPSFIFECASWISVWSLINYLRPSMFWWKIRHTILRSWGHFQSNIILVGWLCIMLIALRLCFEIRLCT